MAPPIIEPTIAPKAVGCESAQCMNPAKEFIYRKESGHRLDATNELGCIGLGQDCNKVLHLECPDWRTNYACQDAFWERYMERRYGSWEKAKAHWLARVPINGRDVGNWW